METVTMGIVGWKAERNGGSITIRRAYGDREESVETSDLIQATEFLTQDFGEALNVTWDLAEFSEVIISLLPKQAQEELTKGNRVEIDGIKIFSVDRWFGVTYKKHTHGNFYLPPVENNFFGLDMWMPSEYEIPRAVKQVEGYGKEIIVALGKMGIIPDRLTSPVGVWGGELRRYQLPTQESNPDIAIASEYCEYMMGREWRSSYKLGYFDKACHYDRRSAYGYDISRLPNTDNCLVEYSKDWLKSDWVICKAEVDVTADKTPIIYDTEDNEHILPIGKRIDIFTSEELLWLHNHKAADIKFIDGYFFKWLDNVKPYAPPMRKLYAMRASQDKMVTHLARRMAHGVSGKLDQSNTDGSYGEFYNSIYASMVRSRCRLAVGDFIWGNGLQDDLIYVQVDGLASLKKVALPVNDGMGSWRMDSESPLLILSKGNVWLTDKKPLGLTLEQVLESFKEHPRKSCYDFGDGIKLDFAVMQGDADRIYDYFPTNGADALSHIIESKPIKINKGG